MGKELLRNGGFERGNIDFWEIEDITSLEALAAAKKHGVYGGKAISSGESYGRIKSKDFIPVEENGLYVFSCWLKNSHVKSILVYIWQFDSDLNGIGAVTLKILSVGTDFVQYKDYFVALSGVSYVKVYIVQVNFADTNYTYIDSVSLKEIDLSKVSVLAEELISTDDAAVKTDEKGEEFFTGLWKHAEYFLSVSKLTATGGNGDAQLNVKIETYDPATELWRDAMVFQEVDETVADPTLHTQYKSLDSNLGWKQRVSYTTVKDATSMECDFKVGVVYKR